MPRFAAPRFALIAVLICLSATRLAAQNPQIMAIGVNPLIPTAEDTPKPRPPLPVTLDFSTPSEQKWLADVNAREALKSDSVGGGTTPADDLSAICNCKQPCEIFHKKQIELQVMTGITYFPIGIGPDGPNTLFLPQQVRFGYIVNNTHPERRFLRGTWEAILEVDTIPIVKGPGGILVGAALYGRYNLSCGSSRWVPYFEMGGGGSWTDSYKFRPTNLSTGFEFILHMAPGVRYLINSQWALSAEFAYYHFSNSGINAHNFGINTWGGLFGITHFFR